MENLSKGDLVSTTAMGGEEIVRRVWEVVGDAVLLCSERQFQALRNGWPAPMPIGFPVAAVCKK